MKMPSPGKATQYVSQERIKGFAGDGFSGALEPKSGDIMALKMSSQRLANRESTHDDSPFKDVVAPTMMRKPSKKTAKKVIDPANFSSNFDNFDGIANLRNYLFITLKDDGNGLGEKPVGVLQLFNKQNGRPIDRDDL